MGKLTELLVSRATALALLAALALFAAVGAWVPEGAGGAVFGTYAFRGLAAALLANLFWSLWRRRAAWRRPAAAGGWLLHLGVSVLIVAGGWNALRARAAPLEIVEGQTVALPGGRRELRLERVHPMTARGPWKKGDAAEVAILENGEVVRTAVVRVNEPLRAGALWFHLDLHGYAPRFRVAPAEGDAPGPESFVSLETTLTPAPRYWRRFDPLPGTDLPATLVFRPGPRPAYPTDPTLTLVLGRPGERSRAVTLAAGRPVVAAGYRFAFGEVRRWTRFRVSREPGLGVVFAAFGLMIAGAALAVAGSWPRVRG